MHAAPAKFLFDQDFSAADGKPSMTLAEHAAQVAEADAAGFMRGIAQATADAQADADRRTAAALERIAEAIEDFSKSLGAFEAKLESEAVEVAVAVGKKLAPELIAREPLAELSALATNCFRHLVATPHVAVRVNDALHSSVSAKFEDIVRRCGLDSRLVVLAEPDIAVGDCRIEWADGGVVRDQVTITAAIDQAVARYLGAQTSTAALQDISWR